MFCSKCGCEIKPGEKVCSECGARIDISTMRPNAVTSIGGWLGWWTLFMFIPIIGWILAICVTKDQNVKNGLMSYILIGVISIAILIVLAIMGVFSAINFAR